MGDDVKRCRICDWQIRATVREGCTERSCSYRPEVGSPDFARIQRRRESVARQDAFLAMTREQKVEYVLDALEARGESFEDFFARLTRVE